MKAISSPAYFIKINPKVKNTDVLQTILDNLNRGEDIMIFPERTTNIWGQPREFRRGILDLCLNNKLDVALVAIDTDFPLGSIKETNMIENYYQLTERRTKTSVTLIPVDKSLYQNFNYNTFRDMICQYVTYREPDSY